MGVRNKKKKKILETMESLMKLNRIKGFIYQALKFCDKGSVDVDVYLWIEIYESKLCMS